MLVAQRHRAADRVLVILREEFVDDLRVRVLQHLGRHLVGNLIDDDQRLAVLANLCEHIGKDLDALLLVHAVAGHIAPQKAVRLFDERDVLEVSLCLMRMAHRL